MRLAQSVRLEHDVSFFGWEALSPELLKTRDSTRARAEAPFPSADPSEEADYFLGINKALEEVHGHLQPTEMPAVTYRLLSLP